jgi:hypothetical protein
MNRNISFVSEPLKRRNDESSEKLLYTLLITHLPTAGRDSKK